MWTPCQMGRRRVRWEEAVSDAETAWGARSTGGRGRLGASHGTGEPPTPPENPSNDGGTMNIQLSGRVKLLLAANLLALAFLAGNGNSASAQYTTWCPPSATGCDCLFGAPLNPDGCHDNGGDDIICSSNEWCFEQPE